ncbi:MAG: Ig-like domain-containing protein [Lachnospiraceae bacterium]|nr:Ig-like domain-containing protein [Lachnospiraceae bacterium]
MKKRRIGRSFVSLLIAFVFTSQAIVPVCGEEIRIDGTTTGGIITAGVSSIFAGEDEILISDESDVLLNPSDDVQIVNDTVELSDDSNNSVLIESELISESSSKPMDSNDDYALDDLSNRSDGNEITNEEVCSEITEVRVYASSGSVVSMTEDAYFDKVNRFIGEGGYEKNAHSGGQEWDNTTKSENGGASGCAAYAHDFVYYVFDKRGFKNGSPYDSINKIQTGDVVYITEPEWDAQGRIKRDSSNNIIYKTPHYFCVLKRDGENLWTAEGNSSKKVRIENGYKIVNGELQQWRNNTLNHICKFECGWHHLDLNKSGSPIGSIDSIGADNGKLFVGGWAYDPDSPSTSIQINVYVEGRTDPIASFKTHIHRDIAGGTNCGFDETIDISNLGLSGKKKVSLWGIDVTGDDNAEIGSEEVDFDTDPIPIPIPMPDESPYDPEIENGKYVLMSALRSDTHLNIEGNDKSDDDDNVNVERGFDEDSYYDVFKVSLLENGYYKLIQNGTNHMAVSVAGRSTSEDANIQMYYWNPEDLSNTEFQWAIKWAKKQDGKPYHYLRARCSGMYMTTAGSSNGRNVYQASKDNDDDYQKWFFARYMKPSIETDSLPNGSVGQSYSATLEADSDLDVAWTFTGKDDSLPPGLSLERSGKITGTPTTPGTYTFSLDAENALVDALGLSTRKYTIVIEGDIPVTGVTLDKSALELNEGASATLTAAVSPDNATDKSVTWKSSDEKIATVSSSGKVTAVKEGIATITVTSNSNKDKSASCKVTVKKNNIPVTSVTLDKTSLEINAGSTSVLTATVKPDNATDKTVTWKSSDEKIATVNSSGKVTAVKEGTATITVTSNSNKDKSASCKVTVKSKPTGIVIKADDVSGAAGSTVSVPVRITGNPGLGGLSLTIISDPALSIESVEKGSILSSGTFEQNKDTGLAQWYTRESAATGDGILFVVKFSVKNGAEKKNYPVNIAFKDGKKENVVDINGNTLNVSLVAGSVNTNRILGDITGDGIIAIGDVVRLARAVSGSIALTDEEKAVADINGDKVIAIGDVVRLARYVEGSITEL